MSDHIQNFNAKDSQHRQRDSHEEIDGTVATDATTNASLLSNSTVSNTLVAPQSTALSGSMSSRENYLTTQIRRLLVLSSLSGFLFLLATFSIPSLFFFTVTVYTMALAVDASRERLLIRINQRGLLYYLPESVQTYLATTTLHEFMTDSSMFTEIFMEYRFLLMYFIPGLSEEQLMNLVNQLPESRRQLLLSQGQIADTFLPEALRNRLYPISETEDEIQNESEMLLLNNEENNFGSSVHVGVPSDLVWDTNNIENDNNNGIDRDRISGDVNVLSMSEERNAEGLQEATVSQLPASSSDNTNEDVEQELEQEGIVLNNAIQEATRSYARSFTVSLSESVLTSILSPTALQRSARFTGFLSFSTLAQWSWSWSYLSPHMIPNRILHSLGYRGIPQSNSNSNPMNLDSNSQIERNWRNLYHTNPMGRILLSSTLFMGVSTGLLYYVRSALRRSLYEAREHEREAMDSDEDKIAKNKKDHDEE